MKNNELMIGNWVTATFAKNANVKITIIKSDYLNEAFAESFYPIPITKDFLKANGFIKKCIIEPDDYYTEGLYEWEKEVQCNCVILKTLSNKVDCDWCVHIDNCDRDSICNIDIQYVHQLQNVLNILGIEMEVVV